MQPIPEMKIDIQVGNEKFTRNLSEDLSIDQSRLDEALENQAALYAYYAIRFQQANSEMEAAKFDYERAMNVAIQTTREELMGSSSRITDKQITAIINNQPEVLAARTRLLELSYKRDQLNSLVRALDHKKDALLSLAYKRRSEIDSLINKTISRRQVTGIEDGE